MRRDREEFPSSSRHNSNNNNNNNNNSSSRRNDDSSTAQLNISSLDKNWDSRIDAQDLTEFLPRDMPLLDVHLGSGFAEIHFENLADCTASLKYLQGVQLKRFPDIFLKTKINARTRIKFLLFDVVIRDLPSDVRASEVERFLLETDPEARFVREFIPYSVTLLENIKRNSVMAFATFRSLEDAQDAVRILQNRCLDPRYPADPTRNPLVELEIERRHDGHSSSSVSHSHSSSSRYDEEEDDGYRNSTTRTARGEEAAPTKAAAVAATTRNYNDNNDNNHNHHYYQDEHNDNNNNRSGSSHHEQEYHRHHHSEQQQRDHDNNDNNHHHHHHYEEEQGDERRDYNNNNNNRSGSSQHEQEQQQHHHHSEQQETSTTRNYNDNDDNSNSNNNNNNNSFSNTHYYQEDEYDHHSRERRDDNINSNDREQQRDYYHRENNNNNNTSSSSNNSNNNQHHDHTNNNRDYHHHSGQRQQPQKRDYSQQEHQQQQQKRDYSQQHQHPSDQQQQQQKRDYSQQEQQQEQKRDYSQQQQQHSEQQQTDNRRHSFHQQVQYNKKEQQSNETWIYVGLRHNRAFPEYPPEEILLKLQSEVATILTQQQFHPEKLHINKAGTVYVRFGSFEECVRVVDAMRFQSSSNFFGAHYIADLTHETHRSAGLQGISIFAFPSSFDRSLPKIREFALQVAPEGFVKELITVASPHISWKEKEPQKRIAFLVYLSEAQARRAAKLFDKYVFPETGDMLTSSLSRRK